MRVVERGLAPFSVVLETRGRTSGQPRRVPLVMVRRRGIRYLVSMLGPDVGWVRNAHAAGGRAAIIRRHREEVVLTEVPVGERAPILRRYLLVAFGARPHMKVRWNSPLRELEQVAAEYPVFRVDRATALTAPPRRSVVRVRGARRVLADAGDGCRGQRVTRSRVPRRRQRAPRHEPLGEAPGVEARGIRHERETRLEPARRQGDRRSRVAAQARVLERALAEQALGVDREPAALAEVEHVAVMEVAVQGDHVALVVEQRDREVGAPPVQRRRARRHTRRARGTRCGAARARAGPPPRARHRMPRAACRRSRRAPRWRRHPTPTPTSRRAIADRSPARGAPRRRRARARVPRRAPTTRREGRRPAVPPRGARSSASPAARSQCAPARASTSPSGTRRRRR